MKLQKFLAVVLSVLLLLSLAGCGSKATDSAVGNEMAPMEGGYIEKDDYMAEGESATAADGAAQLPENRKLIQTAYLDVETENLDAVLQQIQSRIGELGGYVESSNVQNGSAYRSSRYRSADITVRIPAKELNGFVDKVGQITNIVSSRKTVEDVTLSYVATESRMKALQTEETRLLELLAQAETMEDLLTVEARLTQVRTELEQVTSTLRVFDNQVDYATIYLNVQEVKEYTDVTEPETVWQRIATGFTQSLKGVGNFFKELFVFVIVAIPYLVVIGAAIAGVILLVRFSVRRKRKAREAKRNTKEIPRDI